VAFDGDRREVGHRLDQPSGFRIQRTVMGECEDTIDGGRAGLCDREWQVAPEGRAAWHGGQHVERPDRFVDGSRDRMGWVPDGFGQPGERRIRESGRGDDPQPGVPIDDDDHRRLDVELVGDRAEQDLETRPESIGMSERSSPMDQDLNCGVARHGLSFALASRHALRCRMWTNSSRSPVDNATVPYDLERFLVEQQRVYDDVLEELRSGHKTSHWIWFIFPQIAGLGHSPMSQRFAVTGLDEARAYLAHPVLGERLRACAGLVLATAGRTAEEIFGSLDAMKVRSSMTLFHRAAPDEPVFAQVLDRFYDGLADEATDVRLTGLPLARDRSGPS
jgi:uncharacterized protein (DUF1810 family)